MLSKHAVSGLAIFVLGVGVAGPQAFAAPSSSQSQGFYISGRLNGSTLAKPKQTIANAPTPGSTLLVVNDADFGWGGAVAIGYQWPSWRLEAEVGQTRNPSKSYTAVSPISITLPQVGKNDISRYMVNVYHDFSVPEWAVKPYVGVGIGSARDHVTTFAAPARAPTAPPSQLIDQTKSTTAYQIMVGATYPLNDKVSLTAQYRWLNAGKLRGVDSRGEAMTRQLHGDSFDLGMTYRF